MKRISLTMETDDEAMLVEVTEQFARTAAALVLRGGECFITVGPALDVDE